MVTIIKSMKNSIESTKIDYVSVVIPLSIIDEYKFSENISSFATGKKVKWLKGKTQFKKGIVYEQKGQGWWISFYCSPYDGSEHKAKISFNYSNAQGLESIVMLIDKILPGGYKTVFDEGHITRMDFAVDFKGVSPSDFLWGVSHEYKKCQQFINDSTGKLETIYIGSTKSRKYVAIYDRKAANKIPCKDPYVVTCSPPEYDVTRVEVRLQPVVKIPFHQAYELTAALDTVHVLMASCSESSVQTSLELLMRVGSQRFLLNKVAMAEDFLPAYVCNTYRTHLKQNSIGKLCNKFNSPVAELLDVQNLAA